ncbi:GTP-binding protein [Cellulophaga sp. Z1A5H]|uniref:GTP-binding protein n=1 Tax=Cellulophaga sp. Z1A5H TaxID=2687291 RepID=UPI0013FDC737|nr:GTP-binding protein [Cellulophaga sp. Z1A5H]
MKTLPNTIVLRPRFQLDLDTSAETLLANFENLDPLAITCKRMDEHVFLKFKPNEHHFWSPQLHLEIVANEEKNSSTIYGVFGPNPTLWTFFMFLHFGIATLFIVVSIWAYSSFALHKPYGLQVGLMVLMIVFWFSFYAFGRVGKQKGRPQMQELYDLMEETLNK